MLDCAKDYAKNNKMKCQNEKKECKKMMWKTEGIRNEEGKRICSECAGVDEGGGGSETKENAKVEVRSAGTALVDAAVAQEDTVTTKDELAGDGEDVLDDEEEAREAAELAFAVAASRPSTAHPAPLPPPTSTVSAFASEAAARAGPVVEFPDDEDS